MTRALAAVSGGAYLARVRAPPTPAKLWQLEQLVRNRSPPSASSPSSSLPEGSSGPPPSDSTYAASWSIWVRSYFTALRGACAAPRASGIRPDSTWKTTAEAPTPISDGPPAPPWLFRPWQVEQPCRYS